jgi:broad specificity phosphatase PhoE
MTTQTGGEQNVRTIVHVMRHGEVHNPTGVLYGRLPGFSLSERGQRQAKKVAEHLAGRDVRRLVVSPLQRAQETAKPIAEALGIPIETEDGLIEAGNIFEGTKFAEGKGVLLKPQHWWKLRNPFRPSWGEPYTEIRDRMVRVATSVRDSVRGHEAVIVSHQLPVYTLRRHYEGKSFFHDPRKRECDLASLTTIVYEGDAVAQIEYSEPSAGI